MLCFGMYCLGKCLLERKMEKFDIGVAIFIMMHLLYFLFSWVIGKQSTTFIGNIVVSMSMFFVFKYLGENSALTKQFLNLFVTIMVLCSIGRYYFYDIRLHTLFTQENITNNGSVAFLFLFPLLFFIKNKAISFAMFCVSIYFILLSAKRGNILAIIIPAIIYLYYFFKDNKKLYWKVIASLLIILFIYYISLFISEYDFLLKRFEQTIEGNSSSRDILYSNAINLWTGSNNIFHLLFGYGQGATMYLIGNYAHNDWLELLVDNGLLGICVYLYIFVTLFFFIKNLPAEDIRYSMVSLFIIWGLKTCFSMGFIGEFLMFAAIPYGIAISRRKIPIRDIVQ